jgi:hypothetical protein
MNQDQLDSLVRTILKMLSAILIAHGAQQMATIISTPDVIEAVIGVVTAGVSIYASHTSNAPASSTSATTPTPPKTP